MSFMENHKLIWETQIHFSKHHYEANLDTPQNKYYLLKKDLQPVLGGYYPGTQDHIVV